MANVRVLSDFVLTGCAIVPAMGLAFGQPELALFSHVILLLGGLLMAGIEDDAPFKKTDSSADNAGAILAGNHRSGKVLPPLRESRVTVPLHRQSDSHGKLSRQAPSARKLK